MGGYISQDPLGLKGGISNAYSYVKNINLFIDIYGLADFYVTPDGNVIPATGYRYMPSDASYIDELKKTMEIPARADGTYISFDKFDTPSSGKLQVPHDAALRGSFDTLQIVDDVKIPHGEWGKADWLEPITKDFPDFGEGGATQAVTNKAIKLDSLEDLNNLH